MMRILYGIQGTGNGHIARSRVMAQAFAKLGLSVDYFLSGREKTGYFAMEAFADYQSRPGLSFVADNGKINLWQTYQKLDIKQFWQDVKQLELGAYDLVLNDFEPITAWAAKRQKVPCIGISHQQSFRYPVPTAAMSYIDRAILKFYAPCQQAIGLHWWHFQQPVLPPIIPQLQTSETQHSGILVYLPFEQPRSIKALLEGQAAEFYCYHPEITAPYQEGGISWKPLSYAGFQQDLRQADGVVCNAGFELPSEALTLGKKLLVKPLGGQFEQHSNAKALTMLNLGSAMATLDRQRLSDWLATEPSSAVIYPDVAGALATWIQQGDWQRPATLSKLTEALWQACSFPPYFRRV